MRKQPLLEYINGVASMAARLVTAEAAAVQGVL